MICVMKRWLLRLVWMLSLLPAIHAADVHLTELDAGRKRLSLKIGDTLRVTLPSNPSTGYTWEDQWTREGILKSRSEKHYEPLKSEKLLVGGGGGENFHYLATGRGTTTLTFSYLRPWEKSVSPERIVAWDILVE